jgi:ABC-type branched-subunit amino acid transport system substrate-binding protein
MYSALIIIIISFFTTFSYAEDERIKVGAIIGLSGSMSPAGLEMKKGIELALKDLGKGSPIDVIFEDDHSMEQKVAVSAITKLINIDKVKVILTWVYTTLPTIAPIATRAKIPLIEFWDSNEGIFNFSPYVFCSGVSTEKNGALGARFAVNNRKNKKLGIFVLNDPWSELISVAFKKEARNLGAEIVLEEMVDIQEKDFRTLVLKLKKSGAEGVFLPLCMSSLYSSISQLKELGFKGDIYTGDCMVEGDVKVLGVSGENTYSIQMTFDDPVFRDKYKELYGVYPSNIGGAYAALGYDAVFIVNQALKDLKIKGLELNSENIKSELENMRYEGLTGLSVLHGSSEKVSDIVIIKQGKFEKVRVD